MLLKLELYYIDVCDEFNVCLDVWFCMFYMFMPWNCYLAFLGQDLAVLVKTGWQPNGTVLACIYFQTFLMAAQSCAADKPCPTNRIQAQQSSANWAWRYTSWFRFLLTTAGWWFNEQKYSKHNRSIWCLYGRHTVAVLYACDKVRLLRRLWLYHL